MKKIEDYAAFAFVYVVGILSVISILGVWDFLNKDVITKSFQTLGLLAFVAVVVMVATKFIEGRSQSPQAESSIPVIPNPAFKIIRQITLTLLIISVSILAILGVLAIWEVIKDKDVLFKSMSSVGILAFGAFIITMTSIQREGGSFVNRNGKNISLGTIILIIIGLCFLRFFIGF